MLSFATISFVAAVCAAGWLKFVCETELLPLILGCPCRRSPPTSAQAGAECLRENATAPSKTAAAHVAACRLQIGETTGSRSLGRLGLKQCLGKAVGAGVAASTTDAVASGMPEAGRVGGSFMRRRHATNLLLPADTWCPDVHI